MWDKEQALTFDPNQLAFQSLSRKQSEKPSGK